MEGNCDRWMSFMNHANAEDNVPEPWADGDDVSLSNPVARILKKMIIIKILRPDRLVQSCQ